MKLNTTIKTLCAAVALAASAAANANPFYLDIGTDYTGIIGVADFGQVTSTSTSLKTEMKYVYESSTKITDVNDDNLMSAGDVTFTQFGMTVPGALIDNNVVTTFIPNQLLDGTNSNNGYNSKYHLTFGGTLNGVVYDVTGAGVPLIAYAPGSVLNLYITFDDVNLINFMDIVLTGGAATGVSTILDGIIDFSNIKAADIAAYGNLFHAQNGLSCSGGSSGFYDIWNLCGDDAVKIGFASTQDTNVAATAFVPVYGNPDDEEDITAYKVSSNHNGAGTFNVPEPASLALLGMGLFGLGAIRRRKTV